MKVSLNLGYGYFLSISRKGFSLMLNGLWFKAYKNLNTNNWNFDCIENIWRKTKDIEGLRTLRMGKT